jgi:hypothetical protein
MDKKYETAVKAEILMHAWELIKTGYDLHTHTRPSHIERALDDDELILDAKNAGMQGVMIKSHYEPTQSRAILANIRHPASGVRAFGGVVLNQSVGGLNPYAVHSTLKLGGSIVYLPTLDSLHAMGVVGFSVFKREGISLLDAKGRLQPQLYEIMEIVRDHNACLATGHISAEEAFAVCKAGTAMGVRMLLQHPECRSTQYPLAMQKEIADMGVIVEKCWLNVIDKVVTADYMHYTIGEIGAHRIIMVTDHGQASNKRPVDAMVDFVFEMRNRGATEGDIINMVRIMPRVVVGG